MKKLLSTPLGTALKAFVATILTLWMATDDLFNMDIHTLRAFVTAGLMSALPVIINWINPSYTQYGKNKAPKAE